MNELFIDTSVLIQEPAEIYHAQAGEYLGSHLLLDYMRCPLLYHKRILGMIAEKETSSYLIGRAAHVRILEGRSVYEASFAFGGPINPSTGRPYGSSTKAFAQWQAEQGKPVLTAEQIDLIEQMACGVAMNDGAIELLAYGQAEGVVRAEYAQTPCQIRMDWLNPQRGIVDLKTCDDLTWFEADARRFGYRWQMAFYRAVLAQVLDQTLVPVHLIAVEKREPFRCGLWRLSEETMANAQCQIEAALRRLSQSWQNDYWPTGYEEVRLLEAS